MSWKSDTVTALDVFLETSQGTEISVLKFLSKFYNLFTPGPAVFMLADREMSFT